GDPEAARRRQPSGQRLESPRQVAALRRKEDDDVEGVAPGWRRYQRDIFRQPCEQGWEIRRRFDQRHAMARLDPQFLSEGRAGVASHVVGLWKNERSASARWASRRPKTRDFRGE